MQTDEIERLAHFEEDYWWHRGRQTIVRRLLQRYVATGGTIVDVGCGTGATTAALRVHGSVIGVDLSAAAVGRAREREVQVAQMDAAGLALADQCADLVTALDVLEHLDDDVGALLEFRRVLRAGGKVLITVPAYEFLWSSHDEALEHRRRYTRGSLMRAMAGAGLRVEMCSYVMSSILPAAMAVRLSETVFPRLRVRQSGYVRLPGPVNSVLAHMVGLGGLIVHRVRLPFGLSVVAVASREEQE